MALITDPYTFINGTVANALEVNARFDELYTLVNGQLDSANLDLTASYAWTGVHSFSENLSGSIGIKAASAVDTQLSWVPYTSGNTFKIAVPATGSRATFYISTTNYIDINSTEVVFNEDSSASVDVRMESDSNSQAFFLDSSANTILMAGVTVTVDTGHSVKAQTATDSISYVRPATSGQPYQVTVPATGNRTTVSMGALSFIDLFYTSATAGSIVFNEDSNDVDIRMETNGNANAFVLDAGADTLSIGVNLGATLNSLSLLPVTDATYSFGTNSLRYGSINLSGSVIWGTSASSFSQGSITGGAGKVYVQTGNGSANRRFEFTYSSAQPETDNVMTCGGASNRFTDIYAVSGSVNTSDAREKKEIYDLESGLDFVMKLRPVEYKWISGNKQTHWGFIAQEIEAAGVTKDNGLLSYCEESDRYGMRYDHLLAPIVKSIQELAAKLERKHEII